MKGIFFQKPLEFQLQVEGESWKQGDQVRGRLVVKNHGSATVGLSGVQVKLAYGELKKVRAKSDSAFEVTEEAPIRTSGDLSPQAEEIIDWQFQTDRNCPITDTSGSLFLLYGNGANINQLGQIQLIIKPDSVIEEFLKTLSTQFRFVRKSEKAGKSSVEAKLTPPTAKAFVALEQLVVHFSYEGVNLNVKYTFQVKKVDATAASLEMKKEKKECKEMLTPHEYLLPSGRINPERIESSIQKALALVEAKTLF